jgi:hypothetical protein
MRCIVTLKYSILDFVAQLLSPSEKLKMKCWVQIVDSHGVSYKDSSVDKITLDDDSDVADLRDAIKLKNQDILTGIVAAQLLVYQARKDLGDTDKSLNPRQPLNADIEYLVVVPDDSNLTQQASLQEQIDAVQKAVEKLTIKVLIPADPTMKERPTLKRAMSLRKKVLKKVARAAE